MKVHITPDALPFGVLQAVCQDADALADCKNFWVTNERIQEGPDACSTPAELAVCLLYRRVAHLLPPTWQGAEYWVQVYKPGVGLGFHFDKDEHLLKATGQMVHPIWSSILYLTGSTGHTPCCSSSKNEACGSSRTSMLAQKQQQQQQQQHIQHQQQRDNQQQTVLSNDWDGVRQAPTVILEQLFDQKLGHPVPPAPSRSMLVWPVKGAYCLFDGGLGHGVLDSCSSSIRATLLVNWWASCPQAVEQLKDSDISQQHLTRLSTGQVQQLLDQQGPCSQLPAPSTAVADSCEGLAAQLAAAKVSEGHSSSSCCCSTNRGHEQDSVPCSCCPAEEEQAAVGSQQQQKQLQAKEPSQHSQTSQHTQQQQQQERRPWRVLKLEAATNDDDDDSGMQLVDDVLVSNHLSLVGSHAVSAVEFDHPGLILCPIEAPPRQQPAETQGGCSKAEEVDAASGKLQTLGAFVSAELFADDSSCSSEGDGEVEHTVAPPLSEVS